MSQITLCIVYEDTAQILAFDMNAKIAEAIEKISDLFRFDASDVSLSYEAEFLEPEKTIGDYGMQSDDVIQVFTSDGPFFTIRIRDKRRIIVMIVEEFSLIFHVQLMTAVTLQIEDSMILRYRMLLFNPLNTVKYYSLKDGDIVDVDYRYIALKVSCKGNTVTLQAEKNSPLRVLRDRMCLHFGIEDPFAVAVTLEKITLDPSKTVRELRLKPFYTLEIVVPSTLIEICFVHTTSLHQYAMSSALVNPRHTIKDVVQWHCSRLDVDGNGFSVKLRGQLLNRLIKLEDAGIREHSILELRNMPLAA